MFFRRKGMDSEVTPVVEVDALDLRNAPKMRDARMIFGFSGWMDGGEVSTGALQGLIEAYHAERFATIESAPYLIYSFPGPMEVTELFRPHVRIEDGLVTAYEEPQNHFYCVPAQRLILFNGKEPHLRWREFAEKILRVIDECHVRELYFIGSVAGLAPHTRPPRIFASVSHARLKPLFDTYNLLPSNYEGPGSFLTYLTVLAQERNLPMVSLIVEIPAYIQGRNAKCIHAAMLKAAEMLGLPDHFPEVEREQTLFLERIREILEARPDLAELIEKMEEDFVHEEGDQKLDEVREWFEKQQFRFN